MKHEMEGESGYIVKGEPGDEVDKASKAIYSLALVISDDYSVSVNALNVALCMMLTRAAKSYEAAERVLDDLQRMQRNMLATNKDMITPEEDEEAGDE